MGTPRPLCQRNDLRGHQLRCFLSVMDPKQYLESNLQLIETIVRKVTANYRLQQDEQNEIRSYVYERLVQNDYHILRVYNGPEIARSYLILVIRNIFRDYNRMYTASRFRASTTAEKIGEPAMTLEKLLKYQNYTLDQAFEIIQTRYLNSDENPPSRDELETIEMQLKIKPREQMTYLDDEQTYFQPTSGKNPVTEFIDGETAAIRVSITTIIDRFKETMTGEEKILLKMVYEEQLKISEVARRLKQKRYFLEKTLSRIIESFRNELTRHGIDVKETFYN